MQVEKRKKKKKTEYENKKIRRGNFISLGASVLHGKREEEDASNMQVLFFSYCVLLISGSTRWYTHDNDGTILIRWALKIDVGPISGDLVCLVNLGCRALSHDAFLSE